MFRRTDLDGFEIEASGRNVARVSYATSLMRQSVLISTTEHLLSALIGFGVDNVIVEVDNPFATTDVGLAVTVDATALTAPALTLKLLLVAPARPVDEAPSVKLPAAVGLRLLKVAVPLIAATVSVEVASNVPPLLIAIVTFDVLEVRLPNRS